MLQEIFLKECTYKIICSNNIYNLSTKRMKLNEKKISVKLKLLLLQLCRLFREYCKLLLWLIALRIALTVIAIV